ncbi:HEPN domain-containing protein [Pseudomonas sp. H1_B04]
MFDRITELELSKEYSFEVIYRDGTAGYAATLKLTPSLITFKIMSERDISMSWQLKEARCEAGNQKFYLKGMACTGSRKSAINHTPRISFYEYDFNVESVIFCPQGGPLNCEFDALNIFSETVTRWIGYTTTQDRILEENAKGGDVSPHLTEFVVDVNDCERLGVEYNGTYSLSPLAFEQAFTFPPSLFYTLGFHDNSNDPYSAYIKIHNIIAFLCGVELSTQRVLLDFDLSGFGNTASLYFVQTTHKPKQSRAIFFPLGKDRRFDNTGLPPFPIESFAVYFSEDQDLPDLLSKYLMYRSMGNAEDRLLGYFRLLEKHCYRKKNYLPDEHFVRFSRIARGWVKSNGLKSQEAKNFEKGLKRFNGSKYNTEKCLKDFYKSLPPEIQTELGITAEKLEEACKLRNNITHANKYVRDGFHLSAMEQCIHSLLIFALLEKLKVPLADLIHLPKRIYSS